MLPCVLDPIGPITIRSFLVSATRPFEPVRRTRYVSALLSIIILTSAAAAHAGANVLFPAPLHITREVSDPISGTTAVIDEYCHGNRIVSVSGSRTAIVDHEADTLTVIDFASGTYSITKFDEMAKLQPSTAAAGTVASSASEWRVTPQGGRAIGSRHGNTVEAERKTAAGREVIRITADRDLTISRAAMDALVGFGYPNAPNSAADVVAGALRENARRVASAGTSAGGAEGRYALPLEYNVRHVIGEESIETRNVVTRIGAEIAPRDRVAIPLGAKLVESQAVAARRLLEELDRLPVSSPQGN